MSFSPAAMSGPLACRGQKVEPPPILRLSSSSIVMMEPAEHRMCNDAGLALP